VSTTFRELKRRVLLGIPNPYIVAQQQARKTILDVTQSTNTVSKSEGEVLLCVEQGLNDAQQYLAKIHDFPEMMVNDKTSAVTADGVAEYNLITTWGLIRPKDIHSIRLMDTTQSRKLSWIPPAVVDKELPYPTSLGEARSTYYTLRGLVCEIIPTPDAVYSLYIYYSQYPALLHVDTDTALFLQADDVLIALGREIALSYLEGTSVDWIQRAKDLLSKTLKGDETRSDQARVAQPFRVGSSRPMGEYWNDPFVNKNPR
jgi:hypothetical protein